MAMTTKRHAELAALIFHDMSTDMTFYPLSKIAHALDIIDGYDPHAIGFMEKVLTTGPKAARDVVSFKIASITENIAEALEMGENWLNRCSRTLGSELINTVMNPWSVECVLDEYKGTEAYRISMWTDKARFVLRNNELGLGEHPVSFEDWRGLAALGATMIIGGPEQLKGFIKYAGAADNIASVIDTARARNTLDPDTIEIMINSSSAVTLRDGAL